MSMDKLSDEELLLKLNNIEGEIMLLSFNNGSSSVLNDLYVDLCKEAFHRNLELKGLI